MTVALIVLIVGCLACVNGANDNFKGVATLYGSSGRVSYKAALRWATVTTVAGSLCSIALGTALAAKFSGRGVVVDDLTHAPQFLMAVGLGSSLTVLLATVAGFPVSTTHALIGAIVGSGYAAVGSALNLRSLGAGFLLPLLLSPTLASVLAIVLFKLLAQVERGLTAANASCVCVGTPVGVRVDAGGAASLETARPEVAAGSPEECRAQYGPSVAAVDVATALHYVHYLSSGTVCFARGLNDTPKIAAMLVAVQVFDMPRSAAFVAVCIAIGGVLGAKRVAETMSHRITTLDDTQATSANLATSVLVVLSSVQGLPVSTTHVSVGALVGLGSLTGAARFDVISAIALSWLLTLPVACAIGAAAYWLATSI